MCKTNLDGLYSEFKNDETIYYSIERAFCELYTNDTYLICNKPMVVEDSQKLGEHHVGERSIVFRFAYYLQCELLKSPKYALYNVDCEYNRHVANAKILYDYPHGIYPDLIVHKRGSDTDNQLVIEFKAYWNDKTSALENNINKVQSLKKIPYKYKYGLVVIIGKTKDELEIIPVHSS